MFSSQNYDATAWNLNDQEFANLFQTSPQKTGNESSVEQRLGSFNQFVEQTLPRMYGQLPDFRSIKKEPPSNFRHPEKGGQNEDPQKMERLKILSLPTSSVKIVPSDNNNGNSEVDIKLGSKVCDDVSKSDHGQKYSMEIVSQNFSTDETEEAVRSIQLEESGFENDQILVHEDEPMLKTLKQESHIVEPEPKKPSHMGNQENHFEVSETETLEENHNLDKACENVSMECDDDNLTNMIEFPDPLIPSFQEIDMDMELNMNPQSNPSVRTVDDKQSTGTNSDCYTVTDLDDIFQDILGKNTLSPQPKAIPILNEQNALIASEFSEELPIQAKGIKREAETEVKIEDKRVRPIFRVIAANDKHRMDEKTSTVASNSNEQKNTLTIKQETDKIPSMHNAHQDKETTVQHQQRAVNTTVAQLSLQQQPMPEVQQQQQSLDVATDKGKQQFAATQPLLSDESIHCQQQQRVGQQHQQQQYFVAPQQPQLQRHSQFNLQQVQPNRYQILNSQRQPQQQLGFNQQRFELHKNQRLQQMAPQVRLQQYSQYQSNQPRPSLAHQFNQRQQPQLNLQHQPTALPHSHQLHLNKRQTSPESQPQIQHLFDQLQTLTSPVNQRQPSQIYHQTKSSEPQLKQQQAINGNQQETSSPRCTKLPEITPTHHQQQLGQDKPLRQEQSKFPSNLHVAFQQQNNPQQQLRPQTKVENQLLPGQRQQLYIHQLQRQQQRQIQSQQQNVATNLAYIPKSLTTAQKRQLRLCQYPKHIRTLLAKEHQKRQELQVTLQQQLNSNIIESEKKELVQKFAKDQRLSAVLVRQLTAEIMKLIQFERVRRQHCQQVNTNKLTLSRQAQNSVIVLPRSSPVQQQGQNLRVMPTGGIYPSQHQTLQTFSNLKQELYNKPPQQTIIRHPSTTEPSQVNQQGICSNPYSRPYTPIVQALHSSLMTSVTSNSRDNQNQLYCPNQSSVIRQHTTQPQMHQSSHNTSVENNQFVQPQTDHPNQGSVAMTLTVKVDHHNQKSKQMDASKIQDQVNHTTPVAANVQSLATDAQPMTASKEGDDQQPDKGSNDNLNDEEFPDLLGSSLELSKKLSQQ